jgi:hypothetical protein
VLLYSTAQMALSQHLLFISSMSFHAPRCDWIEYIEISMNDLEIAFTGLKTVLMRLVALDLASYAPISMYAPLPFSPLVPNGPNWF